MGFFTKNLKLDFLNGLLGWWKFEENSGTSLLDSSGRGNSGILVNSPNRISGKRGKGLNFNGTNQSATFGHPPDFIFDSPSLFTLCAWIQTSITTGRIPIFGDFGDASGWGFYINNGLLTAEVRTTVSRAAIISGTTNISNNLWTFVTMTYNGGNGAGSLNVYVNGKKQTATTIQDNNAGNPFFDTGQVRTVRIALDGLNNFYTGNIDEVRVYNRVLPDYEIFSLYNSY